MNDQSFSPKSRNYQKTNFVDLLESIVPQIYVTEDIELSGTEVNPISEVINANVRAAANLSNVLSISGVPHTQTSGINTLEGVSQYFVKQNELTNITPFSLDSKLLIPLGTTLLNYESSSAFQNYVSGTLLPQFQISQADSDHHVITDNLANLSALTNVSEASSVHNYLIDTLGWYYFLNTSADGGLAYDPSTYVVSGFVDVYNGATLKTVDGVKGLMEFVWRNYETCSTFRDYGLIPAPFVSGSQDNIIDASAGVQSFYTSGLQKLDNLKTLIDVIYSPLYLDAKDYRVKNALEDYIATQIELNDRTSAGPFRKYLNALGMSFADISNSVENIDLIYDIQNADADKLQYIAELIGWKLFGASPSKWRHQLRSAVEIYKKKGTLESIQFAINSLIVNTSLDVSGQVKELHESYLPLLIWYALGTESEFFQNLSSWTPQRAIDSGVGVYSTSSLEENLKLCVDDILLTLYETHPEKFIYEGQEFPGYKFYTLDSKGEPDELYTTIFHSKTKPFHVIFPDDPQINQIINNAIYRDEIVEFENATFDGPLGFGTYLAGDYTTNPKDDVIYLSGTGDLNFFFNYRGKENYPIPPFEEVKYYRDCSLTKDLLDTVLERLECFGVRQSFINDFESFVTSSAISTDTDLGSLNGFLMFFENPQVPPNYNFVLENITSYTKNLLPLWNGKSSHLHIDFASDDFDFAKKTYDGDGRYGLYEASRTVSEFAPAHAIPLVTLNASASEDFDSSSTMFEYVGLEQDDTRAGLTASTVWAGYESSGIGLVGAGGGDNDGRGGLNTFVRNEVDRLFDLARSTDPATETLTEIRDYAITNVPRRDLRRRSLLNALPKSGYYDRTGFNGPVSYDASVYETTEASSLGELTLGYNASAGRFHPVLGIEPSGVWGACEGITSNNVFSGIASNQTFPYRGLSALGSDEKMPEVLARTDRYVDRGQVPLIYRVMHQLFEKKALDRAKEEVSPTDPNAKWKNLEQSYANEAIASGLILNSYEDYVKFAFGSDLHKLHKVYAEQFNLHALGLNKLDETGCNIFGHVFGKGLFNCDFVLDGSAAETSFGKYIASSIDSGLPISHYNGSGVFSVCSVLSYAEDETSNRPASGTYIASDAGEFVVRNVAEGSGIELRNAHILSGIEFINTSGQDKNEFKIYDIAQKDLYLSNNRAIKFKNFGGMPRIKLDLKNYGDVAIKLIPDHDYKVKIRYAVADDEADIVGGGRIGVWLHTDVLDDADPDRQYLYWNGDKWNTSKETNMNISKVKSEVVYDFQKKQDPESFTETNCLLNTVSSKNTRTDINLKSLRPDYFKTFELDFNTRNHSQYNNGEYLKYAVPESLFKYRSLLHDTETNYSLEIFFKQPTQTTKYMIIDSIEFYDVTLGEMAGLPTGHGIRTLGRPLRPFVKEDKLSLDKHQLREILKFYNGLAGLDTVYRNTLNSRDAAITSNDLETSGGSRLSYRIQPDYVEHTRIYTGQRNHNYTLIQVDN